MGKKKNNIETSSVETVDVDALVNEGKNINVEEINIVREVLLAPTVNTKIEEEDCGEPTNMVSEENPKIAEEDIQEDAPDANEDACDMDEEDCNIDDVITECTGEAEEKPKQEKKSSPDPWYIARLKRTSDYYNW